MDKKVRRKGAKEGYLASPDVSSSDKKTSKLPAKKVDQLSFFDGRIETATVVFQEGQFPSVP